MKGAQLDQLVGILIYGSTSATFSDLRPPLGSSDKQYQLSVLFA